MKSMVKALLACLRGDTPQHATVGKFLIAGQNMISKVNEWTQWEQCRHCFMLQW